MRRAARTWRVVVVWAKARGALLPRPSAEARPHRLRDWLAAGASKVHRPCVRLPWRVSRTRIAPSSIGRRCAEHAPRAPRRLYAWLCCGPTHGALHTHAVGRGPAASTPRQVGGCGFNTSWSPYFTPVASDPCAYCPAEAQSNARRARRARAADLARGCGVGQLTVRSIPTPSAAARPHRHRDKSAATTPKHCNHRIRLPCLATRATRFDPWRTGRRPTEHARAGRLGVVVFSANARRAPPHADGIGSSAPTPPQVGSCRFKAS